MTSTTVAKRSAPITVLVLNVLLLVNVPAVLAQQTPSVILGGITHCCPIVGGYDEGDVYGTFTLSGPAPAGGVIVAVRSSHPGVVSVQATVQVRANEQYGLHYGVTTFPVNTSTSVTVTLQAVSPSQTAATSLIMTVLPVPLVAFGCQPTTVPVGTFAKCTVQLDRAVTVTRNIGVSSPDPAISLVPYPVQIGQGRQTADFMIGGTHGPQPRTITINTSFGDMAKSAQLTLGPAYLKDFRIGFVDFTPRRRVAGGSTGGEFVANARLQLYAAAPSRLKVRVEAHPGTLIKGLVSEVPAGKDGLEFQLKAVHPVAADTQETIYVIADVQGGIDRKSTTLTVRAARLRRLKPASTQFEYNESTSEMTVRRVPKGGVRVKLEAWLEGLAPWPGGAKIRLLYPPSLVTGPSDVGIPNDNVAEDFTVTVHPCPQGQSQCTGEIWASYLDRPLKLVVKVTP